MPERAPGEARVSVSRCRGCGSRDPGMVTRCRRCGSTSMERVQVPGRGRLVSWTVVRRPGGAFAHRDAFAVALVDLDAGLRVTGNLEGWENEPALDAVVEVTRDLDGVPVFAEVTS